MRSRKDRDEAANWMLAMVIILALYVGGVTLVSLALL